MFQNATDEEIIDLYKNGKEEEFKKIVDRYTLPIYNFTARLTDKNNAPDLVQETFIKAWKNIRKFDEEKASFKTWIFIIAKNTAIDFSRKKKSLLFSELENEQKEDESTNFFRDNIRDDAPLPDEALQKLQDVKLLEKILNKIPLAQRTILILHYQEDMTFEEIGKVLDKPTNTVKSGHQRAIVKLRNMLL